MNTRAKKPSKIDILMGRMLKLNLTTRLIILGAVFILPIVLITVLIIGISSCASKGSNATADLSFSSLNTPRPDSALVETASNQGSEQDDYSVEGNTAPNHQSPQEQATPEPTSTPFPVMQKRDRNDEVTTLQIRLMELGYLDLEETTDYFGSGTEYAVKLFQRQHNLKQDGIIGAQTYALLFSFDAQPYMLKEGAEGDDVEMVQERLEELGYLNTKQVDGVYGENTVNAIKAFQKRNKLTQDGKAGEQTLDKLHSDDAKISSELEQKQKEEERKAREAEKAKAEKDKQKEKDKQQSDSKAKRIDKFISAAKKKIGCEYVLGKKGPDKFDCSGLVYYCLRQAGVSTQRLNAAGFSNKSSWKKVESVGSLQKGDIIFFRSDSSSRVSHCGIYIGSGTMIDASSTNGEVVRRALSSYWKRNFVCGRRPW